MILSSGGQNYISIFCSFPVGFYNFSLSLLRQGGRGSSRIVTFHTLSVCYARGLCGF